MPASLSRQLIAEHLFVNETKHVRHLVQVLAQDVESNDRVKTMAMSLANSVRKNRKSQGSIDSFMQEYSLSSEEGVMLMCLAEALLRIPDADTQDKLIADKIGGRDWEKHLGKSDSLFVNASAWGLMLTGRIVSLGTNTTQGLFGRLTNRMGEPVIRQAMRQAMRMMGRQFVLGRTIEEALAQSRDGSGQNWRYSFDMLGESALTAEDATRYMNAYEAALRKIAQSATGETIFEKPSLSVKLSALHPRYEERAKARVLAELKGRVVSLAQAAKQENIGLTIDAEEMSRLDLSMELFAEVARDPSLAGWNGLGLAVQAYSRRAEQVLHWLGQLAAETGRILPVRLVKGAYWDTEIKRAQEGGFEDFPVFTRKPHTDISYLACARFMLNNRDRFYPQFATHNAHSVAAIVEMAGADKRYEFQRLHGMGQSLYENVISGGLIDQPCRIYAPVGSHEDLLAYLVRRLLENGANASFVNRLADDALPLSDVVRNPVDEAKLNDFAPSARIKLPSALFGDRQNSHGIPSWHAPCREPLLSKMASMPTPAVAKNTPSDQIIKAPYDRDLIIGHMAHASETDVTRAIDAADAAQYEWDRLGGNARAAILDKAASLFEEQRPQLLSLLVREAGKTLDNAIADHREAVDFLRYYAQQARHHFEAPQRMPGPTGEHNSIALNGRGIFACISPWNFPLAIFAGQVAAALASGNAVLAKPAEQTPLVAALAVKLMYQAGIPASVLHLLPGDGARLGKIILADQRVKGVAFTGSTETAKIINRSLAARDGAIATLIAETGGMNAMIVDSSALPEHAVRDCIASAFDSAGQRCSAARLLFVQNDCADRVLDLLKGAMNELVIGNPEDYATDVGPVIDQEAKDKLDAHKQAMARHAVSKHELQLPPICGKGTFVAPAFYELADTSQLKQEVFGPILHVVRYQADHFDKVLDQVNAMGYGLTLGLHTRIDATVERLRAKARVGNIYVNRNQIGAVVGAQPFGGEGLSGTGPKAGGPHYLQRFAVERVVSVDTTASGGNAELVAEGD
jgi:RHH-type transcriptional regulator, proline utilization regulon repressor / proline dehydrogenase / delta 1-pyrroline-5-carboxylate dehydrogenase